VLTLVEAILENPDVVLHRQLDKLKTERMDEMKAQGIEYEQRIAELEEMEWPKPNRDFIYTTFNAFADKHPWIGETNIRPKSVAREMYETFASFAEYVRDYGLQRSEGVLLRYLSDVYKTLTQAVPAAARTDELLDVIVHFRQMLQVIDSSLLDEWESLKDSTGRRVVVHEAVIAEKPRDLAADPKALAVRVRAELHALLKALSARDHAGALACLAPGSTDADGAAWTEERLAAAMAPYWAAHPRIDTTPAARRPHNTIVTRIDDRPFRAQQRIIDPAGDEDWSIDCLVDLDAAPANAADAPGAAPRPLLALQRIGT
ncbi:MAG TPA: DUF3516 domain-containing protein, partial [Polyangia bacterium]|nr:DUF3516 domain-containing protein [Polyangia bacterium]